MVSTYLKWQIGLGIAAVLCRAARLAWGEYPRVTTTQSWEDVFFTFSSLGFIWWAASCLSS